MNKLSIPTPHIEAAAGDFAETVLLPGDPLRARHIAENYLDQVQQVTGVRGMLGFTGTYRGTRISVMGSGMGIPSCSIYAHELVSAYGVRRLLRIGTCGTVAAHVAVGDLVLAQGASTDSAVNRRRFHGHDFAALASWDLCQRINAAAVRASLPLRVGNVFSTDLFYAPDDGLLDALARLGVLGIEMEASGLFGLAAELGVEAAALLTVSDHLRRGEHLDSDARQCQLDRMIRLALEAVIDN